MRTLTGSIRSFAHKSESTQHQAIMNFLHVAFKYALLFQAGLDIVRSEEINGNASPGNFILKEESSSDFWSGVVKSNVPVTIQRFGDERYEMDGEQPFWAVVMLMSS